MNKLFSQIGVLFLFLVVVRNKINLGRIQRMVNSRTFGPAFFFLGRLKMHKIDRKEIRFGRNTFFLPIAMPLRSWF